MCSSIGVDPLASNKGFWSDLLGVGDFYSELGVQIIQISLQSRGTSGGIMSLKELHERLSSVPGRRTQRISTDDIKRSIEKISVLGNGLKIIEVTHP
jgi:ESCRT-II complex subunit VPS22